MRCLNFDNHKSNSPADHQFTECTICQDAELHAQKTRKARESYQRDMELDNGFSVDMQKVMLVPKLTSKEHVFVSRVVCFN